MSKGRILIVLVVVLAAAVALIVPSNALAWDNDPPPCLRWANECPPVPPPPVPPVPPPVPPAPPAPPNPCTSSNGKLVFYTRHSRIEAVRLYISGHQVAVRHPRANSVVIRYAVPAGTAPKYRVRVTARLKSQRTGRHLFWTKLVRATQCKTSFIDP